MKLISEKNAARKYQQGGPMAAPEAAPAGDAVAPEMNPQASEDAAMQQIAQMASEIVQKLGPEAAVMLAEAIMEMVQGAQQEAPVFKAGGKLAKKCGGKMKKK